MIRSSSKPFLNLTANLQLLYYRQETTMPKSGNRVGGLNLGPLILVQQSPALANSYASVVWVALEHAWGKWQ